MKSVFRTTADFLQDDPVMKDEFLQIHQSVHAGESDNRTAGMAGSDPAFRADPGSLLPHPHSFIQKVSPLKLGSDSPISFHSNSQRRSGRLA